MEENPKDRKSPGTPAKGDPGLFESIGSFPVWLLKMIDVFTPDFLIKKTPPRKDEP